MFQKPSNSLLKRLLVVTVLFGVCAFAAIAARLFKMQVVDYSFYRQKAISSQTRDTVISPERGTIYDRNMKVLAASASAEMVSLTPRLVKDDAQAKQIAEGLSSILGVEYDTVYKKATKESAYELVMRSVEKDTADQVRAFASENEITAIAMQPDTKRYYPYGSFAANVLGFMGTDQGLSGLESYYETNLKGITGRIISARNAKGVDMSFKYERYFPEKNGDRLVLTLDEVLQSILEKNLNIAIADNDVQNKATGIIMDVKTGAILAMATKPDFDPNDPFVIADEKVAEELEALTGDEYKAARSEALQEQWQSRALTEPYEPGSTFKIITSAIAIEEKVLGENDYFSCPGYIVLNGTRISCWKAGGHGSQNFLKAIQNSCNPAFVQISQKIGTETFRKYFESFGFMEKTGIDLGGEAVGVYHSESNFHELELAIASFGQRFKVTPLQMITAVSAVANGGYLMKPYIVEQILDENGTVKKTTEPTVIRQVISEETSKTLCGMLEQVVASGSGSQAGVPGYRVAGKTGTSEKKDRVDEYGNDLGMRIASFIGFAPADDPQIAVLVLLDEPMGPVKFGGQIAAPVVRRILSEALPYIGVEPQYTEEEMKSADVTVPDLVGLSGSEAERILSAKKIAFRRIGSGDTVTDQTPAKLTKIPGTSTVLLYLGAEKEKSPIVVADVSGMGAQQARKILEKQGLYVKTAGVLSGGTSFKQTPAAGETVEPGTVVTVEFRDTSDHVG